MVIQTSKSIRLLLRELQEGEHCKKPSQHHIAMFEAMADIVDAQGSLKVDFVVDKRFLEYVLIKGKWL
jgi:hypothetical protein